MCPWIQLFLNPSYVHAALRGCLHLKTHVILFLGMAILFFMSVLISGVKLPFCFIREDAPFTFSSELTSFHAKVKYMFTILFGSYNLEG